MQIAINLPWARQKAAPFELPNVQLPRVDVAGKVEDTKRVVSDGADTISATAQDLGNQAATLGREAVRIGKDVAMKSRGAAASTIDDIRSIRLVRESRRGLDPKPGIALLAGASAGLAAMFFLDPEQGRRRRILFMDQVRHYSRRSNEWLEGTTRELRNKSQGWAAEARKAADNMRSQQSDLTDDITHTPDIAQDLTSTDWVEPVTAEPVETYKG